MPDFSIKSHDRLPSIRAALQMEVEKIPVDLTNSQPVRFIMSTVVGAATKVNSVGVIEAPATAGIVRYDWAAVDTDTPGTYLAEWEVTWVGGKKQTFPTGAYHTIAVLADLDAV